MDQSPTEEFSGHHVMPTIDPNMKNSTSLSISLGVYNSTQTNWTSDENFELSTTPLGMLENVELSTTAAEMSENFELSVTALWVYFTVRIIWGCLAIVGNSLTILVVAKYERLQTCTNYLICNLAVNDLIAGVVVPLMMVHELFPDSKFFIPICLTEKTLALLILGGALGTILCLSIDRYIYIAHALRYHLLVTPQCIGLTLGIGWIFALLTVPSMVFAANHLQVGMTCTYFIFLDDWVINFFLFPQFVILVFSTIGFHLAIARIAHRQARAIAAQQQPYATMETAINQSTKKIRLTLLLVLGVYLLAILPQVITARVIKEDRRLLQLQKFTNIIYWANSWVNPLIYVWRLKDFRIAFRKLLTGTGHFNEVP